MQITPYTEKKKIGLAYQHFAEGMEQRIDFVVKKYSIILEFDIVSSSWLNSDYKSVLWRTTFRNHIVEPFLSSTLGENSELST